MSEMGAAREDVKRFLNQWADELDESKGTIVPGMGEMARQFARVVGVQNDALAQNAQRGAALVRISDHWQDFIKATRTVQAYLDPVIHAVAQVRESEAKKDE